MGARDRHALALLIRRFPIAPAERNAFAQNDTESTLVCVEHLVAAAHFFNVVGVAQFGRRLGPTRGRGLVEQVVAAAFQRFESTDPHPGPFDKAAMLLRGITQGHPFDDGNKRTGFLVAAYFLDIMGFQIPESFRTDRMEDLAIRLSAGEIREIDDLATELSILWDAGAL